MVVNGEVNGKIGRVKPSINVLSVTVASEEQSRGFLCIQVSWAAFNAVRHNTVRTLSE